MQRDLQADGLKFCMIFLVVLGHMNHLMESDALWVRHYIYAFHMPVFIFLLGYFTSVKSDTYKFLLWVKRTLIIFVVSQTFYNYLLLICHYDVSKLGILYVTPLFCFWYIISLIYWRIGLRWIADKMNMYHLFILSCILAFIMNFIPINYTLSLHRTFTFAPFFVLGYIFRQRDGMKRLEQYPYWLFIIPTLLCLFASRYLPVYIPSSPMGWKAFIATSAIAMVLCISIVRMSRIRFIEHFAVWGKYTLWVYVGHAFLLVVQSKVLNYFSITMTVPLAILLTIVQVALITFIAMKYDAYQARNHTKNAV